MITLLFSACAPVRADPSVELSGATGFGVLAPLDAGTLEDALVQQRVAIPREGLGDDIAHLRELELLELTTYDGYQRYRPTIPLLAEWIRRNKDFSDLARTTAREQDAPGE